MQALTTQSQIHPGAGRRLGVLVLVSIGLHLLLMNLWQTAPVIPLETGPVVKVRLNQVEPAQPLSQPSALKTAHVASAPKPKPAPTPTPASQTHSTAHAVATAPEPRDKQSLATPMEPKPVNVETVRTTTAEQTSTTLEPTPRSPGISLEAAKAEILARVRDDFSRHFTYPLMARKRGWEGEVRLGLHILANGNIDHIVIAQSSGHSLLDRSALKTLNRIGRITEATIWLQGRSLELTLPVIYRLTNS